MSNFGQAALTIVGTVVGAYFGYPQLGFMLGSLAGQAFFPTKLPGVSGPRLSDARTTTAQLGAPVMEVIGTDAVPGNVNWMAPLREVATTEEVGGKGGPSQSSTTYSYFQSISVGICRGPMGGLLRVWENGKLVYDVRPQLESESDATYDARIAEALAYAENFVFYYGDEEQMPDPTIEADKGEGMVPAWRGLCYIVFPNRQLKEEQGLRHPNFKFEVSKSFVGSCNLEFSNEVLYPWLETANPLHPLSFYTWSAPGLEIDPSNQLEHVQGMQPEFIQKVSDAAFPTPGLAPHTTLIDYLLTDTPDLSGTAVLDGDDITHAPHGYRYGELQLLFNRQLPDAIITSVDYYANGWDGVNAPLAPAFNNAGRVTYMPAWGLVKDTGYPASVAPPVTLPNDGWVAATGYSGEVGHWFNYNVNAAAITITREPSPPDPADGWTLYEGHIFRVLQQFGPNGGGEGYEGQRYPLNPCVPLGDPNFDDQAFWEAAYEAAVESGDMPAGYTYENQYPVEQSWAYVRGGTPLFLMTTTKVYPWLVGADPRNPLNVHTYKPVNRKADYDPGIDGAGTYDNLNDALSNAALGEGFAGIPSLGVSGILGHNPSYSSSGYAIQPWTPINNYADPYPPAEYRIGGPANIASQEFIEETMFFGNVSVSGTQTTWGASDEPYLPTQFGRIVSAIGKFIAANYTDIETPVFANGQIIIGGYQPGNPLAASFYSDDADPTHSVATGLYTLGITVARVEQPPPIGEDDPFPDLPWIRIERPWRWLMRYQPAGIYFNGMASLPQGPALPVGHPNDTEEWWTEQYEAAVLAGRMEPGLEYGTHYPAGENYGYARVACDAPVGTAGLVSLASVIEYLCGRVGIAADEIDVSDLTSVEIVGYTITRVMSARDAIEPLRNVGFFDVVDSGAVLKFVKRGKAVARVIDVDDFAHEQGQDPGPDVTTKDALETDLPRTIRVHYKAPSRDYEDGEQISPSRSTAVAVNDLDLEIAVALPDNLAAQIAEVVWADAWEGRRSHEFTLDAYHQDVESGDVLGLPVDGYVQRVRVGPIDESLGVLRKFQAFRDYDGNYVSQAVADPPERAPGTIVVLSPSEILFLDLPALRDTDDNAGVYAVTRPTTVGATWKGASIYRSTDEGATFAAVGGTSNEPTTGTVVDAIPEGDSHGFDERYSIDVEVRTGSFESRTEASIYGGANTIAVGAHGRWELLQFVRAEQINPTRWRLSRLLRGRKGTEWAMGTMQDGDTVVLVSGPGVIRLPYSNDEIGIDVMWKAVTFGMEYNTGIDATFATTGEALRPYSPIDVVGETNEAGDLVFTWLRRGRLGHELTSGTEIPLSEASEAYEIDIVAGSDVVRTLTSTTETVTYTVAQQVEDFGSDITPISACVYQMSAVVGRGHPGCTPAATDANEVEGSLEALPFIAAYDDRPCLLGTSSEGFYFARRGRKGEKFAVGFYFWPAGASPGGVEQFDDNYDGGGSDFWPSSYFAGGIIPNSFRNEGTPTRGFRADDPLFSFYWRQNPAGTPSAQKWLISGRDDDSLNIVPRGSVPLSSTTRNVNALLPMGEGVIYALASEISIAPTQPPDVYRSLDDGETWTFVATTTGLPAFEWLAPLKLFQHGGKVHLMSGFGNYVNDAEDFIDWDDQSGSPTTLLEALRGSDPIAAITDFDYTDSVICAMGFSAESFTSDGGFVGQKNRILRSTDAGATWTIVRDVPLSSDFPPSFMFPLDWLTLRRFGTGFIVYGKSLVSLARPYALISTDGGVTWGDPQVVDVGDPSVNSSVISVLSDGSTILAIDTYGERHFNSSNERDVFAGPTVYGRLSYSTDGLNFTPLPGFPNDRTD